MMLRPRKIKILLTAWLFLGLNSSPIYSQETSAPQGMAQDTAPSLLFSDTDWRAIAAAVALRPAQGILPSGAWSVLAPQPENRPVWLIQRLHLSALIYTGPQKWTLWFDGRRVERDSMPPFLQDLRVTADYVDLSVIPTPGAAPIAVRLRPNQTFLISKRRIAGDGAMEN